MKENAYKLLETLKIAYEKVDHPPLFTRADAERYQVKLDCMEIKNLLLCNKDRSRYYMVIVPLGKRIDLKQLQEVLRETRLTFADEETLYNKLGVRLGAVSLLNLANVEHTDIKFLIDKGVIESEKVGFHPNDNTQTVIFDSGNILKILTCKKTQYQIIGGAI